jgi:hypothetical protein
MRTNIVQHDGNHKIHMLQKIHLEVKKLKNPKNKTYEKYIGHY